jgi:hypothetical protein
MVPKKLKKRWDVLISFLLKGYTLKGKFMSLLKFFLLGVYLKIYLSLKLSRVS